MKHYFIFKDFIEKGIDKGIRVWDYIENGKMPIILKKVNEVDIKEISKEKELEFFNYYYDEYNGFDQCFREYTNEILSENLENGKEIILRTLDVFIRLNGWTCDNQLPIFLEDRKIINMVRFSDDRYANIVDRYPLKKKEEKPFKKERTEKILPGEIVVDPNDQASILSAIDEEIKLLQSSHMIDEVRKNNGYYNNGKLYEGDFFVRFGCLDEKGFFKEYSYEEFGYSEYYEALIECEEGRQRLYTYVKLITAYLQNGIGLDFGITSEGVLHSFAFLWLLIHDPKAHYLFPAYQVAAGEWRSLTEDEPADHHYMIEDCDKDCKEVAHTMINLLSDSGAYMMETMEKNIHKFPYERFIEDEEWLEELHRAFAAVYMDKRKGSDVKKIEEYFKDFFKNTFFEYIDHYFLDEDFEKVSENPEKLLEIYAELEEDEVEDIDEWTAEALNNLSKLYPVFVKLDKCIDIQEIHQIVLKTINGEMEFPRVYGRYLDIDDLPELISINSEDDGDLLRELKE
ncbi:hypothetical protein [Oceanirhabdus seepicola]|uniref:Uncharacterized protein n=1 Tax=Oceanirhabdus seepicola TaxID=2828781 RepID=A0A9J6NWL6_9CLOT|nr:hypothetical protein [Oceanirhabdus seepicola]MCM1988903.1 hypothetical protein [Oceanirhabdus seepicola]